MTVNVKLFVFDFISILALFSKWFHLFFYFLFNNPYDSKIQCTVKYKHGLKHQGARTYTCSNTQSVLISTNIITNQC